MRAVPAKGVKPQEASRESGNTRRIIKRPSGGIPSTLEVTSTPITWAETAGGNSALTFAPFQTSNGSTGGNELASFLLSVPQGARRLNTNYWETGGWEDGFYGQDQWKIRNNLTINIGLRYDVSIIPMTNNILGNYYDIFDFVQWHRYYSENAACVQYDTVCTLRARWDLASPRGRIQPTWQALFS